MRRNLLLGAFVISLACTALWQNRAVRGQNGIAPYEAKVALVDVAHLFKNYSVFKAQEEQLKLDAKEREQEIAAKQQELKDLLNLRNQFNPGTPDYQRKEVELAQKKAELDLLASRAQREFQQRDAALYHETYSRIEAAVASYAQSRGITLVLRSSRDEDLDPDKPQDVVKQITKQVVFANPQMDITLIVLDMLERGSGRTTNRVQDNNSLIRQSGRPVNRGQFK